MPDVREPKPINTDYSQLKIANLACGGEQPPGKWWMHFDQNGVDRDNFKVANIFPKIPVEDGFCDGVLASHFLEHLTVTQSLVFLTECYRIMKPGGIIRIVVPDPEKFYTGTIQGELEWGDAYYSDQTFMQYALFYPGNPNESGHEQLLEKFGLYCLLLQSGFHKARQMQYRVSQLPPLADIDNRPLYSLYVEAEK